MNVIKYNDQLIELEKSIILPKIKCISITTKILNHISQLQAKIR